MSKDNKSDKPNWSHTLNLPQYKLDMRAKLPTIEPEIMERWNSNTWWDALSEIMQGREVKVLHDGPPYANGPIHIGHAVNKTLKDIINRCFLLDGYATYYQPGWDCHGLPIELKVEQKLKIRGNADPLKFIENCRKFAGQQIDAQKKGFARLGVMARWEQSYTTMQPQIEANSVRVLADLFQSNHITKGMRPVHWCSICQSALAEAEIEYQDVESDSIYVSFPVTEIDQLDILFHLFGVQKQMNDINRLAFLIWTTTPWTIPSNIALAVNTQLTYAIYEVKDTADKQFAPQHLIIAEQSLDSIMQANNHLSFKKISMSVAGAKLIGTHARHPLHDKGFDRMSTVVSGDHVIAEQGTGIVHTAPDHGMDDWKVCRDNGILDWQRLLDSSGRFVESSPMFAGETRQSSNALVIEALKHQQSLISNSKISHSVGHCWRHKKPIFFRATPQWFITMSDELRANCMAALDRVNFYPEKSKERLYSMMRDRPDWCISRQRYWGLPIGLLINKKTDELHPDSVKIMRELAVQIEQHGVEVWHKLSVKDIIGEEQCDQYYKTKDILDVWFDSGVTHSSVLKGEFFKDCPEKFHTVYLEGSDQHRGWFQSSLITSVALNGEAPYQDLITHGFVVDEKGEKMSKSLGNVKSPEAFFNKLGADILRLWVASSDFTTEIVLSDQVIEQKADIYRRIRNTIRFLYGNCTDYNGEQPAQLLDLDLWLWQKASLMAEEVIHAYRGFEYQKVSRIIHIFCRETLGSFYLDVIKDRLYTMKTDSTARRSSQAVMSSIADLLVALISPILPYTAEQAWLAHHNDSNASREDSIFFHTWQELVNPQNLLSFVNKQPSADWNVIMSLLPLVRNEIEKNRTSKSIKSSMAASITIIPAGKHIAEVLLKLQDELKFIFLVSGVSVLPSDDAASASIVKAVPAQGGKCSRCWYVLDYLDGDQDICQRCANNIDEAAQGEHRFWA